jgi:hypothetical protein
MPCGHLLGRGFLVLEQSVRRFDGRRTVTPLWNTASRMNGHRRGDGLDACDAPDIGQFRSCTLGRCPALWFVVYTNLQGLTPYLSLV